MFCWHKSEDLLRRPSQDPSLLLLGDASGKTLTKMCCIGINCEKIDFFCLDLCRAQAAGAAERARVLEEFWNRKRAAHRNKARGQVKQIPFSYWTIFSQLKRPSVARFQMVSLHYSAWWGTLEAIFREVFLRLSDIFGAVAKVRVRFKLHKYWKTAIIHARCYCNRLFLQSQQKAPKCKQAFFKYPATDCFLLPFLFSFRILMFFPIITHQVGVEML